MLIPLASVYDKLYIPKSRDISKKELKDLYTYVSHDDIFTTFEETDLHYIVPANSLWKLDIKNLDDTRIWKKLNYSLNISSKLRHDQQEVVDQLFQLGEISSGLIQARCGWGKTYTGTHIIAKAGVSTLILVHTSLLFYQWIEELKKQIPNIKIGMIGDNQFSIEDITVGLYISIRNNLDKIKEKFSLLLVDEVHRAPAEVFSSVVNSLPTKVQIGLSATMGRKDGRHLILPDHFTNNFIIANDTNEKKVPYIEIVETDIPFFIINPKREWAKALTKLCSTKNYVDLIVKCAIEDISNGRCPLIPVERISMVDELCKLIPGSVKMVGETTAEGRKYILDNLGTTYKAVITTTLFDEGISAHRLDTLYITAPASNLLKLEQRIGRIERDHSEKQWPKIVDFWLKGPIVMGQQLYRARWYSMTRERPEKKSYSITKRI